MSRRVMGRCFANVGLRKGRYGGRRLRTRVGRRGVDVWRGSSGRLDWVKQEPVGMGDENLCGGFGEKDGPTHDDVGREGPGARSMFESS
jgi:hypothetical protein